MDNLQTPDSLRNEVASIKLKVQIVSCHNIPRPANEDVLPNVYVTVELQGIIHRTETVPHTSSPIFAPLESSFDFIVLLSAIDRTGASLLLTVRHQDTEGAEEVLGEVNLEPSDWFPCISVGLDVTSKYSAFTKQIAFEESDNIAREIPLTSAHGKESVSSLINVKLGFIPPPLRDAAGNFGEQFALLLARAREAGTTAKPLAGTDSEVTTPNVLVGAERPSDLASIIPQSRAPLDAIKGSDVLHQSPANVRVVRLAPGVIVKYGGSYIEEEIVAHEFASQHTTIPIPKILYKPPKPMWCLVTEEVEGVTLESCLELMNKSQLDDVARQLRDIVSQLRSIKQEHTSLGQVDGSPYYNPSFWIPPDKTFETVQQFNDYWRELLNEIGLPDVVDRVMLKLPVDDPVVFCHGDLTPRNIIMRGSTIVGIVDWACAAWYPEYWEYVRMWTGASWTEKWEYVVHSVLTPREQEARTIQNIMSDVYFNL